MNKLPKAPLQEAIFELRWPLQPDSTGRQLIDAEYLFALGKFQEALKNKFPHHVAKFPSDFPHQLLNYQAVHQFWKEEDTWPVIQLGPGIATVNDTEKNYVWDKTYLPNIKTALEALKKSYGQLGFNSLSLRYIDVVRVADYGKESWEAFVEEYINFSFINRFHTRGKLQRFHFEQSFEMAGSGLLNVTFSTGLNNKKEDIFIWQTAVNRHEKTSNDEVISWLKNAHECSSAIFKEICKKEFYASFS
ncbi:MAG: TIGR04255 family protein [Bacteroidia bacterium]